MIKQSVGRVDDDSNDDKDNNDDDNKDDCAVFLCSVKWARFVSRSPF